MSKISREGLWSALKALLAALPLLAIAFVYFLARGTDAPVLGLDPDWLRTLLLLELLAIHSFPFLGLLAVVRPATPEFRGLKWLGVAAMGFLYVNGAQQFAGWPGVLAFASLTGATYLGFLLNWTAVDAAASLTVRWMVNFSLLVVFAIAVSLPSDVNLWQDHTASLTLGALYFGSSGLVELTGFYRLPTWGKLGRELAESLEPLLPSDGDTAHPLANAWRSLVPFAGTVLLVVGPLFSAACVTAVVGRFIKSHYEWPDDDFMMQFWLPVLMSGILLALRAWHVVWITRVFAPDPERAWWRRRLVIGLLALLAILYVSAGNDFRDDAFEVANYRGFVPRITYASYLGSEGLLAFFLVPITWWTITIAMRRSRGEELRSSG
jgi:hypothetical protein